MSSNPIVVDGVFYHEQYQMWENSIRNGVSEIEEEEEIVNGDINGVSRLPLEMIREEIEVSSVFSFDFNGDDVVYVVVGKQSDEITSMEALMWALDHTLILKSPTVFLIHVFPETKYVPTPLGKLPISQVNPQQKDHFLEQARSKRRQYLQKFLNECSTYQVKVDTILIESDTEAKAILDLIPILNIKKLIIGSTKSNARRLKSRRSNGGAIDQILHDAPECCEVKVICEGKEISELAFDSLSSPSSSPSPRKLDMNPKLSWEVDGNSKSTQEEKQTKACGCFNV